jgi:hypothetical protein
MTEADLDKHVREFSQVDVMYGPQVFHSGESVQLAPIEARDKLVLAGLASALQEGKGRYTPAGRQKVAKLFPGYILEEPPKPEL